MFRAKRDPIHFFFSIAISMHWDDSRVGSSLRAYSQEKTNRSAAEIISAALYRAQQSHVRPLSRPGYLAGELAAPSSSARPRRP